MIFGGLRAGEFGPILNVFQVNPPHKTAVATTVIQDASMPVRVYVDAGVDIWVAINSTADSGRVALYLQGHYEPL
jgi:hypothetical protein